MSQFIVKPDPFFNRTDEMDALERAWQRPGAGGQMAMVYGRRRLGKTYLLQKFFAGEPPKAHCYYLADQTTAVNQRRELAAQILEALPDLGIAGPEEIAVSWNALFRYVSQACRSRARTPEARFGLILDEFPYLVDQSPELPSILQSWWDREGLHTPLFVVLCGSQLSAMAALGEASQPLYGRFNAGILKLAPLRYEEVAHFYAGYPHYGLAETLLMYGILGGTPRYHALVNPAQPMAQEVVDVLLRPQSPLENEVRFLLGSQQIREPAPYNAILGAIASGTLQYGEILNATGVEHGSFARYLRVLAELGWIRRELPFGETRDRRALYRVADPFLAFWYRFVVPLASELQFSDPARVYAERIAPHLPNYMGWHVFEEICHQWLQRHARERLGLTIHEAGRYWNRDGQIEIDVMAKLENVTYLYGECKWSGTHPVGLSVYNALQGKVARLPRTEMRQDPTFVLFSTGGFTTELEMLTANPENRLHLVGPSALLPGNGNAA
ncbi:MAG: ATP-binding protein [Armatimonadota bacterium]|nr:ATP-binding protein [Armatimonadota bacterium]